MGILESLRSKFGTDLSDVAALTRQLGEALGHVNRLDAAIAEVRDGLPLDMVRSIDAGAGSRNKLAKLQSERAGWAETADALRKEIDAARAAEDAAELGKAWDVAAELGAVVVKNANDVDALCGTLALAIEKMRDAVVAFEVSLPARARDYDSSLQRHGASFAFDAIRARLQNLVKIPKLREMAKEEITVALRVRPSKQESVPSTVATAAEASE